MQSMKQNYPATAAAAAASAPVNQHIQQQRLLQQQGPSVVDLLFEDAHVAQSILEQLVNRLNQCSHDSYASRLLQACQYAANEPTRATNNPCLPWTWGILVLIMAYSHVRQQFRIMGPPNNSMWTARFDHWCAQLVRLFGVAQGGYKLDKFDNIKHVQKASDLAVHGAYNVVLVAQQYWVDASFPFNAYDVNEGISSVARGNSAVIIGALMMERPEPLHTFDIAEYINTSATCPVPFCSTKRMVSIIMDESGDP